MLIALIVLITPIYKCRAIVTVSHTPPPGPKASSHHAKVPLVPFPGTPLRRKPKKRLVVSA